MKNQRGMQGARRLFFIQLSFCVSLAFVLSITKDSKEAYSFLLGGLTWIIPQVIFARLLFQDQRARFAKNTMRRVFRAEALKLMTSALLFAVVFGLIDVAPLMFFIGYLTVYGTSWFAPLFFKQAKNA